MKKKVTEDLSTSEIDPRVYEVSFWLVPTISESELPAHFDRLKKVVSDAQGEFISEEAPYMREMTYQMVRVIDNVNKRFNDGYFGWVKFRALPQNAIGVKNAFEKDTTLIRSLLVETVEENTTYTKRPESKITLSEEVIEDVVSAPEVVVVPEVMVETVPTKEE
jgi:ribosomal protein S6